MFVFMARVYVFDTCLSFGGTCYIHVFVFMFFRQVHMEQKQLQNVHRNVLDGDLLWRFLYLGSSERTELAKRIGTSNDQVLHQSSPNPQI